MSLRNEDRASIDADAVSDQNSKDTPTAVGEIEGLDTPTIVETNNVNVKQKQSKEATYKNEETSINTKDVIGKKTTNVIDTQAVICEEEAKTYSTQMTIGEKEQVQSHVFIDSEGTEKNTSISHDICEVDHQKGYTETQYTSINNISLQIHADAIHILNNDTVRSQTPEQSTTDFNETSTKMCHPCHFDDINEEAVGFCVVCAEYLCKGCIRDHKRNKITRGHMILQDEQMPVDVKAFAVLRKLMQCQLHPEQDVAYRCSEHATYICILCLAQLHRKCDGINELGISDEASKLETLFENLNDMEKRLAMFRQKQGTRIKLLKEEQDNVLQEGQTLADQWVSHIETLKLQMKQRTSILTDGECTRMEHLINESTATAVELESTKELVQTVRQYGRKQETDVVLSHLQEVQSTIQKKISLSEMEVDKQIKLLNTVHVSSLGHLADVQIAVKVDENVHLASDEVQEGIIEELKSGWHKETQVDMTLEAQLFNMRAYRERTTGSSVSMHKIKTATDLYTCSISAIGSMRAGYIIFADESNKKLKVWGFEHDIVHEYSLSGSPIDMCISGNKVYICYSDRKKISSMSVWSSRSMNMDQDYPTANWPVSVSPIDNRLLVLFLMSSSGYKTTLADTHVEIRRSCAIDATLTYDSDDDQIKLDTAKKVLVMSHNKVIFGGDDRISCYNIDETQICLAKREWFYKSYNNNVLKKASGMAVDEEENVYVCGEESNNVHQVSSQNYRINRVIINDIPKPISVFVDTKRAQLIIGCRNDNYVHVYSFV